MSIRRCKSIKVSLSSEVDPLMPLSFSSPSSKHFRTNESVRTKVHKKHLNRPTESSLEMINSSGVLKITQSSSNLFQIRNPVMYSKNSNLYKKKNLSIDELDLKIKNIEEISRSVGFTVEVFESYQEVFSKIIEKSGKQKQVLEKIKSFYDNWIKIFLTSKKTSENTKIQEKNKKIQEKDEKFLEISEKFQKKVKEIEILTEKIAKLSLENARLGKEKENARKQFDEVFEFCGFNSNEDQGNFTEDWKSRVVLGFKQFFDQSFEDMKKELFLSQNVEKKTFDVLNILMRKGHPVEKILSSFENSETLERWRYFNKYLVLKPYQKFADFIMNMSCATSELITFGGERNVDLQSSGMNIVLV